WWLEVPFGKLGEQGKANKPVKKQSRRNRMKLNEWTLALAAAGVVGVATSALADDQDMANRIQQLEKRMAELEGKKSESGEKKESAVEAWIGASKFSGFASAS